MLYPSEYTTLHQYIITDIGIKCLFDVQQNHKKNNWTLHDPE